MNRFTFSSSPSLVIFSNFLVELPKCCPFSQFLICESYSSTRDLQKLLKPYNWGTLFCWVLRPFKFILSFHKSACLIKGHATYLYIKVYLHGWGVRLHGVEPASCYQKVAGSIPLVCILKCPWARYWTPNCSWCAGWHLALQPPPSVYECRYELL